MDWIRMIEVVGSLALNLAFFGAGIFVGRATVRQRETV